MVYLLVFFITTLLFVPIKYKNSENIHRLFYLFYFILPCYIILVLFIGLRKNVGIDYNLYYNMFYFGWGEDKEFGFRMLNDLFRQLNLPLSSVLIFMAALSLFFVFNLIIKESKSKVLSFMIFWLDGGILYLLNVIRQGLTNFIYLNIIGMVRYRKYVCIFFLTLFASLFHYSIFLALLLIPFLLRKYSQKTFIILFFAAIFIMQIVDLPTIFIRVLEVIPYFGEIYLKEDLLESLVLRSEFGFGYLFRFILVFASILYYEKILLDNVKVLPYLNAYIFWGILKILTIDIWIFERVLDYLRYASIIVVPYIIMAVKNKYARLIFGIVIMTGYLLLYLKSSIYSPEDQNLNPYKWIFSD